MTISLVRAPLRLNVGHPSHEVERSRRGPKRRARAVIRAPNRQAPLCVATHVFGDVVRDREEARNGVGVKLPSLESVYPRWAQEARRSVVSN